MKSILSTLSLLLAATQVQADFTEAQLPGEEGDLAQFDGWQVQRHEEGEWRQTVGVVKFSRSEEGNGMFVWKELNAGESQARIVKLFPRTESDKVLIRFSIRPGTDNLAGPLHFNRDTGEGRLLALQFQKGRLFFLEHGRQSQTDTGIPFQTDEFNEVEIQITFSERTATVLLNSDYAGHYEISPTQTAVGAFILFGGASGNEMVIKDLNILSVDKFDHQP